LWSLLLLVACETNAPEKGAPVDADGDGHRATEDCDDADPRVNPAMPELCDGLDNDCNEFVDDAPVDGLWVFEDNDGDGFGVGTGRAACGLPSGAALVDGDCDDGDAARAPGLDERCDGLDNDCNDRVDDDALDADPYAADLDGDGWGDGGVAWLCAPVQGLAPYGACDDDAVRLRRCCSFCAFTACCRSSRSSRRTRPRRAAMITSICRRWRCISSTRDMFPCLMCMPCAAR
jgi:hypothetical protein